MFRNPAQYAFILVNVEVIFFIIHYFNFGFLECTMFILFLVFFGKLVYIKNETFFVKYIKKESLEKDESDELVDKFTYFLSTIGSRIHCFYLACKQKGEDDSLVSRIIWLWFLSCLFLLTKIISTYSFFFIVTHLILIMTPIYFQPSVYPVFSIYVNKIMELVAPKIK